MSGSQTEAQPTPPGIGVEVQHEGPLVLGDFDEVVLVFTAPEGDKTEGRPLRASVNVGKVGELERIEHGRYRARYVPPVQRHPQIAIVAVWRETGPDAEVTFLTVPLHGRTSLPVRVSKNARVRVIVGKDSFGPVVADRLGRAKIPIVVPPGLDEVVAIAEDSRGESQVSVKTNVPRYNRLTLAVTPYLVPADGESKATILAYYAEAQLPDISEVRVVASTGQVVPVSREGPRYRFSYTPARGVKAKTISITASVRKDATAKAETTLALGTPEPQQLLVYSRDARPVVGRGSEVPLSVFVVDRLGLNVPGVTVTATSADIAIARVESSDQGETKIVLSDPEIYPASGGVHLEIGVVGAKSPSLQQEVRLTVDPPAWPVRASLTIRGENIVADGSAAVPLRIELFDAAGRAFEGSQLTLSAQGAEVTPVTELGQGVYESTLTPIAGATRMVLALRDMSGRLEVTRDIPLLPPASTFAVGPRVAMTANAGASFEIGAEAIVQRPISAMLIGAYGRVAYRPRSVDLPGSSVLSDSADLSVASRLHVVPLTLGARFAVPVTQSQQICPYASAGATLALYSHRTVLDVGGVQANETRHGGSRFGMEGLIGVEVHGGFLEAGGSYLPLSVSGLESPSWSATAALGYRWSVL